jgi:hypothetical protein
MAVLSVFVLVNLRCIVHLVGNNANYSKRFLGHYLQIISLVLWYPYKSLAIFLTFKLSLIFFILVVSVDGILGITLQLWVKFVDKLKLFFPLSSDRYQQFRRLPDLI